MVAFVPDWLVGVWTRDYIQRADSEGTLGPPDSSVDVLYLQTPYCFCDVRRNPFSGEGNAAFAGVATVENITTAPAPLVKWHACLDMEEPRSDAALQWQEALSSHPRPTADRGYFERLSENLYRERDPGNTLEEQWKRVQDGRGKFLAALLDNGAALLVVAGDYFGFAMQPCEYGPATFCAGKITISCFFVELCATDAKREGTSLKIPGKPNQWKLLPGSTLELDLLHFCFQQE